MNGDSPAAAVWAWLRAQVGEPYRFSAVQMCTRCGSAQAPLVWSSQAGFLRRVCASQAACTRRRRKTAGAR